MKVFVISTPNDAVRKQNYETQFKEQGITDYEIIQAEMILKAPVWGIVRSHKKAIQLAKYRNYPEVIVAEDDLKFTCHNSYRRFISIYKDVPEHVNLFLSGWYDSDPKTVTDKIASLEGKISGLHFYIVRANFYDTLLAADEAYNLDYWLSSPEFGRAITWGANPMVCIQNDNYSYNTRQITQYNTYLHARYKIWNCLTP